MLLKWIFTLVAILYLYRVLMQLLRPQMHTPPPPPAEPPGTMSVQRPDKRVPDGDYIDYEELPP